MRKLIFVSLLCYLATTTAFALVAAEEWIDIPVVINIVGNSDANNVKASIKKANDILKQAKIRLIVKKTNNPFNIGNNDGNLTGAEGTAAQRAGQTELNNVLGAGKGIKITVADDVWTEKPNTTGWSIHRNPVVFAEPSNDPNTLGRTMAHEISHSLTVENDLYDANDANDLMYGYRGGGTIMSPNDINEIRTTAKRRGDAYFVIPRILPGQSIAVPPGIFYSIDARGAILDGFFDQIINDPNGNTTGPNDPTIAYTDLREITVFADKPLDPNSFATLNIQLGGLIPNGWQVDSFFDIYVELDPVHPGDDAQIHIELQNANVLLAEIHDLVNITAPPISIDTVVYRNNKFDVNSTHAVGGNHSLEAKIPIELIQMQLTGAAPITLRVDSQSIDHRDIAIPIQSQDSTSGSPDSPFPFSLDLPCSGPALSFSGGSNDPDSSCGDSLGCFLWNLNGTGFTPGGDVEIEVDGVTTAVGTANAGGCLRVGNISSGLSSAVQQRLPLPPYHWVIAKEVDDSGPQGAQHATGFFVYIPNGKIIGDLDWDGDVDLGDFSYFAQNWLAGK